MVECAFDFCSNSLLTNRTIDCLVGPEVHVEKSTVRAYKDMSLELVCVVRGYPQPTVSWSFHPKDDLNAVQPVTDPIERRNEVDHAFESVLLVSDEPLPSISEYFNHT